MSEYNITINASGITELVVARVSKESYDYWSNKNSKEIKAACNDEDDELDIPDDFRLSNWHGMNSEVHICAPNPDEAHIVVTDEDFEEVFSDNCDNLTRGDSDPDHPDYRIQDSAEGSYLMKVYRGSNGDYFTGVLEVDDFDADNLKVTTMTVDDTEFLLGVQYVDGDKVINIENTDDTYQDITGIYFVEFLDRDEEVAIALENE